MIFSRLRIISYGAIVVTLSMVPQPARSEYLIATVGDSVTKAITASIPCDEPLLTPAYACPDGTGYIAVAANILDRRQRTAFQNVAVRGANTVTALVEEVPNLSPALNVVVIFIGIGDRLPIASGAETLLQWEEDYATLVAAVHEKEPHARVILATIPNPAYVPYYSHGPQPADWFTPAFRRKASDSTLAMDRFIGARSEDVLDLLCMPYFYESATLNKGLWYPNDRGYEDLGARVAEIVLTSRHVFARKNCAPYSETPR